VTAPLDPRLPVVVGVAAAGPDDEGPTPVDLMARAAEQAAADAGAPALLPAVDLVLCPRGSWPSTDPARALARRFGAGRARTVVAELGILQSTLVSRAAAAVVSGAAGVVLVAGGEARRRASRQAPAPETSSDADVPDEVLAPQGRIISAEEIGAGLLNAPSHYALLENARRGALGISLDDHLGSIAELWSRFSAVAAANPRAAFPRWWTADELRSAGEDNRMIAFPYRKWEVSQWNVDQAAALLVCSVEAARAHGVASDRWVFLHATAESDHMVPVTERPVLHRSPGFSLAGRAALEAAGTTVDEMDLVDLYSCFPVAVFTQASELGIPLDRALTVTGGMTFGGGPLNNYVLQAAVEMCRGLRGGDGRRGLQTAVSGMVTKQGVMVWGSDPPARGCRVLKVTAEVEARVSPLPVGADGRGPATVLTYTVMYGRPDPERAVVLAGQLGGVRALAVSTAPDVMAAMAKEEWLGRRVILDGRGGFTA
jgi:acetyl-CoA C-acetyltransferase